MTKDSHLPSPQTRKKTNLTNVLPRYLAKPATKSFADKAKAAANLQFNTEDSNPEFGSDFRTAMTKVLAKMSENSDDPSNEVLKLLVSGEEELTEEINKVDIHTYVKILNLNLNAFLIFKLLNIKFIIAGLYTNSLYRSES